MLEIRYIQCFTSIHVQKFQKGIAVCGTSLMKKMCHQKRHNSPTKCRFSQMSRRNTHQESLWEPTQLLLLTSNLALIQTKLSTLLGLYYFNKLCIFKMHSSAPKRLLGQMSRRNADNKLMWKKSQLQCLTSIHAHKLTKSSVYGHFIITKKMSFEKAYFPTKCHFSQISRHNADNKLMWEITYLQCLTLIHAYKLSKFSAIQELQILKKIFVI